MKLSELKNLYHKELNSRYSEGEIDTIFFWIAEKIIGKPQSILKLALNEEWYEFNERKLLFHLKLLDLKYGKPIQYILGETEFYGMRFFVNENVLIPRPETEELIEWILTDVKYSFVNIIDLGTGSGCIPIVLKKNLKEAKVTAIDISQKALDLAKINAEYHHTHIDFKKVDFLNDNIDHLGKFDIIVSNPPYIANEESHSMDENVTKFEPEIALFVPDNDPLIFYKKIIEFAQNNLKKEGKIYLEINQHLAEETRDLFLGNFEVVELKKDISGNDRMICAHTLKTIN